MSTARNINDRNVWNSRSRNVAICLGFTIIVPVLVSITIRCMPFAASLMMMPRDDPGGAIYWILFGSGCFIPREKGFRPGLNKCLRTNWSSWEKAHSVSESSSAPDDVCTAADFFGIVKGAAGGVFVFGGVGVSG